MDADTTPQLQLADFDFDLPREKIASRPARPRDASRLLEVRASELRKHVFASLPELLSPGDLLVFNDTRVIPTRLKGRRGAAKVEVTLHKRIAAGIWLAFAKPARRLKQQDRIEFAGALSAEVVVKGEGGEVGLDFGLADEALMAALGEHGKMPLPPYISRPASADANVYAGDSEDYQTIFASRDGAVAAPTAGLHFTRELLDRLAGKGIASAFVTLHVGAGTFLPVKTERLSGHVMHAEWGEISESTAAAIDAARTAGGRIVAVGTTSLRLLESAARRDGTLRAFAGETDIFITPGYRFRACDLLITNFHLPRSTLFMLVAAFAGLDPMKTAYAHAMAAGYRFYSYGDACLLHPVPAR
ncbi:MAG: tRNA preQ1(34) S-adenosylmethionine ribosyltransferase-isomerase QueA [Alphaproteobacteria bacterium]